MPGAPSIAYLDGWRLLRALRAGMAQLFRDQDQINRINVFPVADGDTGTNLVHTIEAMVAALERAPSRHLGEALMRSADAGIDHARGNSGALAAQFFQGMADAAPSETRATPESFVERVIEGARYAHWALSEPQPGTLVTVLDGFAEGAREAVEAAARDDFAVLLEHAHGRAERDLAATQHQLPALTDARVVDAGAAGFKSLLDGIRDALLHEEGRAVRRILRQPAVSRTFEDASLTEEGDPASEGGSPRYRFCTECVVTGEELDPRRLREALSEYGDSLVIAGGKRKLRVHLHTDDPQACFAVAGQHGEVGGRKADDMHRQLGGDERGGRVAVVTDSAADVPEELLDALDIHVAPIHVHFGEQSYLDKLTLTWEEFYRELAATPHPPSTSQPAPGELRRLYQFLASHYKAVLAVHLGSALSGTVESARQAARQVAERTGRDTVHVYDSRTLSAGLGLLVMDAAERARSGWEVEDLIRRLDAVRPTIRVWGAVADLRYAVRGGRVPAGRQRLVDWLRLTPVLTVRGDGKVDGAGVLPGKRPNMRRLARFVRRRLGKEQAGRILIGHCDAADAAEELRGWLARELAKDAAPHVVAVGPGLGTHAGPGSVVVAVQCELSGPDEAAARTEDAAEPEAKRSGAAG